MAIIIGNNRPNQPINPQPIQESISSNNKGFTRYVGYNNEKDFENQLITLYIQTKTDGVFIDKSIPNPSSPEVAKISSIINATTELTQSSLMDILTKIQNSKIVDFSKINPNANLNEIMSIFWEIIVDIEKTSPKNVTKNTFLKFICWFSRYTTYKLTNLLYIGDISKYEIYWLYILSRIGCTVNYVNFTSDDLYSSIDINSKYSRLIKGNIFTPLTINFGKINVNAVISANKISSELSQPINMSIKVLDTLPETFNQDILCPVSERKAKFLTPEYTIPVYSVAYIGCDDEDLYRNMLFTLKVDLASKNKQLVLVEQIKNPDYSEAEEYYNIQKTNDLTMLNLFASKINISSNAERNLLCRKRFIELLKNDNSSNLYNTAVKFSAWIKKHIANIDFENRDVPVFIYYGNITKLELIFLNLVSSIGFDTLYFCPDKNILSSIKIPENSMQILEFKNSFDVKPFPTKLVRAKIATHAYNAERDLDNILYNDNVMFRNYQFRTCYIQTLKTTFEEIEILWHQEAKFRPGFEAKENYVMVPNIFAKINGIQNSDAAMYIKDISLKLAPHSIYYNRIPFFKPPVGNDNFSAFVSNGVINADALKNSKFNRYQFLNDDIQKLLFAKLQEVVESDFLDIPKPDIYNLVIKTGLSMDTRIINLIQNFDFTKDIPKIVIVSSGKHTFSPFECILLVLLNLLGFDIIVYTPTGYKNLETFIKPNTFETYTMNTFKTEFTPPNLRIPKEIPREKSSFLGRIFGKK